MKDTQVAGHTQPPALVSSRFGKQLRQTVALAQEAQGLEHYMQVLVVPLENSLELQRHCPLKALYPLLQEVQMRAEMQERQRVGQFAQVSA